jgi:hypothetical protein
MRRMRRARTAARYQKPLFGVPGTGTRPPVGPPPRGLTTCLREELTTMVRELDPVGDGPTGDDIAAIEAEWPLIEAEMALVYAEIRLLTAVGGPSPLDWRRVRRAEQRVMREVLALAASEGAGAVAALASPLPSAA